MTEEIAWRPLTLSDVATLGDFAPASWGISLDHVLLEHLGRDYFIGRVGVHEQRIVAVGHAIANGTVGWIGNLIVSSDMRRVGLGRHLMEHLMHALRRRHCRTVTLIATADGRPLYEHLGFIVEDEYIGFETPPVLPASSNDVVRLPMRAWRTIAALDERATGERRRELLRPHLGSGWGVFSAEGRCEGFFLPGSGAGPIIARNPDAGVALLRFRARYHSRRVVVPASNAGAVAWLRETGATELFRVPRMRHGSAVARDPSMVFARGSGYSG